jgi:5'-3' exonuclease
MGIKDLTKTIEEIAPGIIYKTTFEELDGYRVAVDISIFLHKFIKSGGLDGWLDMFIYLLRKLKYNRIKAICIFDGPNPPQEKLLEQQKRREGVEKIRVKCRRLQEMIKIVEDNKKLGLFISEENMTEIKEILKKDKNVNYSLERYVLMALQEKLEKMKIQCLPITPDIPKKCEELIECFGFAHFTATGEAEGLCSAMCIHGIVDAVLSNDTDVLVYGTPQLFSLKPKDLDITVYNLKDILEGMNFTFDQFRDMCILLKCDYNKYKIDDDEISPISIRGVMRKCYCGAEKKCRVMKKVGGIGGKKVICMIKGLKSIEGIIDEEIISNIEDTKYERCREIFSTIDDVSEMDYPCNKKFDVARFKRFVEKEKCTSNVEEVVKGCNSIRFVSE